MPATKPTRDAAAKNRAYVAKHRKRRKEEAIDCIMKGIIIRIEPDIGDGKGRISYDLDATAAAAIDLAATAVGQTRDEYLQASIRRTLANLKELKARAGRG